MEDAHPICIRGDDLQRNSSNWHQFLKYWLSHSLTAKSSSWLAIFLFFYIFSSCNAQGSCLYDFMLSLSFKINYKSLCFSYQKNEFMAYWLLYNGHVVPNKFFSGSSSIWTNTHSTTFLINKRSNIVFWHINTDIMVCQYLIGFKKCISIVSN